MSHHWVAVVLATAFTSAGCRTTENSSDLSALGGMSFPICDRAVTCEGSRCVLEKFTAMAEMKGTPLGALAGASAAAMLENPASPGVEAEAKRLGLTYSESTGELSLRNSATEADLWKEVTKAARNQGIARIVGEENPSPERVEELLREERAKVMEKDADPMRRSRALANLALVAEALAEAVAGDAGRSTDRARAVQLFELSASLRASMLDIIAEGELASGREQGDANTVAHTFKRGMEDMSRLSELDPAAAARGRAVIMAGAGQALAMLSSESSVKAEAVRNVLREYVGLTVTEGLAVEGLLFRYILESSRAQAGADAGTAKERVIRLRQAMVQASDQTTKSAFSALGYAGGFDPATLTRLTSPFANLTAQNLQNLTVAGIQQELSQRVRENLRSSNEEMSERAREVFSPEAVNRRALEILERGVKLDAQREVIRRGSRL